MHLQIKQLLQLPCHIIRVRDRVSNSPRILIDLIIIAALERLVAKEVDRRVRDTAWLLSLVLEVLQAIGLVPASWEHIEGDLATDRVTNADVSTP